MGKKLFMGRNKWRIHYNPHFRQYTKKLQNKWISIAMSQLCQMILIERECAIDDRYSIYVPCIKAFFFFFFSKQNRRPVSLGLFIEFQRLSRELKRHIIISGWIKWAAIQSGDISNEYESFHQIWYVYSELISHIRKQYSFDRIDCLVASQLANIRDVRLIVRLHKHWTS